MLLGLLILLPFLGSLFAALLPSNARNFEAWLAGAVTLGCLAIMALLSPQVVDGGVVRASLQWLPQY
ncbi:MAG TPA: hypothetical protein VGA44_02560, partial [Steroidobacteraceae bacterium]